MPNGLVREHLLEVRPTRIAYALCEPSPSDLRRTHVANDNEPVSLRYLLTLFMQEVLAAVPHFSVDAPRVLRLTSALRRRQSLFGPPGELRRFDLLSG